LENISFFIFSYFFVPVTFNLFELSVELCSYIERKAPGKEPETENHDLKLTVQARYSHRLGSSYFHLSTKQVFVFV